MGSVACVGMNNDKRSSLEGEDTLMADRCKAIQLVAPHKRLRFMSYEQASNGPRILVVMGDESPTRKGCSLVQRQEEVSIAILEREPF